VIWTPRWGIDAAACRSMLARADTRWRLSPPTGFRSASRHCGVVLIADTCIVVTPILPEATGTLVTNSGKFAHYTPANTGL